MKNYFMGLCLLISTFWCFSATAQTASQTMNPIELVRKIETQYQGKTSHGKTRMSIKTSNWARTLEMESWSEGRESFLTKILSPRKEKGTCTLKVENNIWNYLPKIDRMIKIPSSLMGDSWMGSHLTNDDLVKENKIDELYELNFSNISSESAEIVGIPKKDAAVVWGKILYKIDLIKMIPIQTDYFDEEGEKVRTISFSDVEKINGRWLPKRMRITPIEKPGEYTEMLYLNIEFDVKISKGLFSIKSLRK